MSDTLADLHDGYDSDDVQEELQQELAAEKRSSQNSKDVRYPIRSICTGEAPWKYLNQLKVMQSKKAPKVLPVSDDFMFARVASKNDDRFKRGVVIKPSHILPQEAGAAPKEFKKYKSIGTRENELLVNRGGKWFYFGTYKTTNQVILTPQEFGNLPSPVKGEVYKSTEALEGVGKLTQEEISDKYAKGELLAVRYELSRTGFNNEIYTGLMDAVTRKRSVSGMGMDAMDVDFAEY